MSDPMILAAFIGGVAAVVGGGFSLFGMLRVQRASTRASENELAINTIRDDYARVKAEREEMRTERDKALDDLERVTGQRDELRREIAALKRRHKGTTS